MLEGNLIEVLKEENELWQQAIAVCNWSAMLY